MRKTQQQARIHMFRSLIGLSFDDTEQLYLTPAMAKKLATELNRFAKDAEKISHPCTRIVEQVSEKPYPVGKARAYSEATGKAAVDYI